MQNKTQIKVLNNKIGIQILAIVISIVVFALGICCCTYFGNYLFILIGSIIALTSAATCIIALIKLKNYCLMLDDINSKQNTQNSASQGSLDDIKNKMISLKDMKDNGLITDTDYEDMKSKLINNCGSNL